MNINDPRLTAFALDELDEPERSAIAREVAQSPEAQTVVDQTREMASMLKNEFAAELNQKSRLPLNLSDIRDDPWFWGIGRPLAIAAALAIVALITGVSISPLGKKKEITYAPVNLPPLKSSDVQAEVTPEFHEEFADLAPAAPAPAQTRESPVDLYQRDALAALRATKSGPGLAKKDKASTLALGGAQPSN